MYGFRINSGMLELLRLEMAEAFRDVGFIILGLRDLGFMHFGFRGLGSRDVDQERYRPNHVEMIPGT